MGLIEIGNSLVGLERLPDETLFSWCSRYHRLAANGHDRRTCMQLFDHPRMGSAHDFPSRIDVLVSRSGGTLGAARDVIRAGTMLPFYLPFKSPEVGDQAVTALRGNGIGSLKYRLGLLTSGMGAAHPLKACPRCIENDLATYGWTYWRREQQLPGVWMCPLHCIPLHLSQFKSDRATRFSWVLPTQALCEEVGFFVGGLSSSGEDWLLKLTKVCCQLVACEGAEFSNPGQIARTFKQRLFERELADARGRVRWQHVNPRLKLLAEHLARTPGFTHQATLELLRAQFARLLSSHGPMHAMRYVVWIAAWFVDLEDFRNAYQKAGEDSSMETGDVAVQPSVARQAESKADASQVLLQVKDGLISLSAAAKLLGVTYDTAATWAARDQIEVSRRPKTFEESRRQCAVKMLRSGADKKAVAKACSISEVTVTRVLRRTPGLQEEWNVARHESRRSDARSAWSQVARLKPYIGITSLRRLEPSAYTWLYRHDRDWLIAQHVSLDKHQVGNYSEVRLERADQRMAAAVERLMLDLAQGNLPLSFPLLKRSLPALARVTLNPESWPLTVKVLKANLAAWGGELPAELFNR